MGDPGRRGSNGLGADRGGDCLNARAMGQLGDQGLKVGDAPAE
jgi:hypothetical protein